MISIRKKPDAAMSLAHAPIRTIPLRHWLPKSLRIRQRIGERDQ
jgi:hypothetical protein